jgi:hypothetical protein
VMSVLALSTTLAFPYAGWPGFCAPSEPRQTHFEWAGRSDRFDANGGRMTRFETMLLDETASQGQSAPTDPVSITNMPEIPSAAARTAGILSLKTRGRRTPFPSYRKSGPGFSVKVPLS